MYVIVPNLIIVSKTVADLLDPKIDRPHTVAYLVVFIVLLNLVPINTVKVKLSMVSIVADTDYTTSGCGAHL